MDYRFDLVDPLAQFALAKILAEGADRYGVGHWRKLSVDEHISHALAHIEAAKLQLEGRLSREDEDEHLLHAYARLHFALVLFLEGRRRSVLNVGPPGLRR